MAQGSYLNAATATEPVCVLGAAAAQRLGIDRIYPGERIWLDNMWFYVAGILNPAVLTPEIDSSVLVGFPAAEQLPRLRRPPLDHLRARADQPGGGGRLGARRHGQPREPRARSTSPSRRPPWSPRPTPRARSTICSWASARVALLVGAVGVANIMVISVLERRSEIGLRRALGATKGHIRIQFLSEAILLALVGGAVGVGARCALHRRLRRRQGLEPSSCPPSPGPAASAPPSSSAPSPGSGPLFVRPHVTHRSAVEHVMKVDGELIHASRGLRRSAAMAPPMQARLGAIAGRCHRLSPGGVVQLSSQKLSTKAEEE